MIDYDTLNEPQYQAVMATEGPLLVLAGAGSGKTRVLTYRIAHMIDDLDVKPWEILAITFTNKAAAEMRERLGKLVGLQARGMWVSTFHSMCVRILRANAEVLGWTQGFTIYDADDSKRLVKEIMRDFDIDPKRFPVNTLQNRISMAKNDLIVPEVFADRAADPVAKVAAKVYTRLQERLKAANAFDFDDLLLYTYLLLKHHPHVLDAYQQRFRYLLVDEYQDTNKAQYAITKLLAAASQNIMVVGDDDQSIYSWRGADIRNILNFEQDYPQARVIKLEQNYRSTGTILKAANAVIANNQHRKKKTLFTSGDEGSPIGVYQAPDERDEGRWIAGQIEKLHTAGTSYDDVAVFYRTNAQSRMLEDMLLRAGVPYRIVGGVKFFERAEVKDVMAYLTLVVNPADDLAVKRVINTPRRGVGKTTVEHLEQLAWENRCTLMEAIALSLADGTIRASVRKALGEFWTIIQEGSAMEGDLRPLIENIIEKTGLIRALEAERTDESLARVENIKEFLGVVDEFATTHDDEEALFEAPQVIEADDAPDALFDASEFEEPARVLRGDSLADFIEWVRLRTDLDAAGDGTECVTLMTVHSSKGLEFDNVFVAGMEESLFPHSSSSGDPAGVEEERRLAYVAITRARKRLCMTFAQCRQLYGQTNANPVSRFMGEIPRELKQVIGVGSRGFSGTGWEKRGSRNGISGSGREAGEGRVFGQSSAHGSRTSASASGRKASANVSKKSGAGVTFAAGDAVDHKTFGKGKVVKVDGDTLQVHFPKLGQTKKLLKDFAPIVKISQ